MPIGTIRCFRHTQGSGLVTIVFNDGTEVHADAGPTFRALQAAFGTLLGAVQKTISYEVDDLGVLYSFEPFEGQQIGVLLGRTFP